MKSFRLHSHYSSTSRYLGRNTGYSRTTSTTSKYKLYSSKYKSLLEESKQQLAELDETESTSKTSQSARTKASDFTKSGSKYNLGMDDISSSIDDFAGLLKKDELDYDKAYKAAEDFVDGYNSVYSSIKNSAVKEIANKSSYFNNLTKTFSRALEKIGISVNAKDGSLSIDKEKFSQSSVKDVKNIFDAQSSFATLVEKEAGNVSKIASATTSSANTYSGLFGTSSTSSLSGSFFSKKY